MVNYDASADEFDIKSVSDFIRCVNEEIRQNLPSLFGAGLKKYLLYLLSAGVNGKLIIDYCSLIGKQFISFADQRSMKGEDLETAKNKLDSVLTNKVDRLCIEEICKVLSQFVSFDSAKNEIDKDFSDSRFLKIPKLVEASFRGHADYNWHAQASIFRGRFLKYEREMYYEMIERAPDVFDEKDVYKNLVLMQHYSCPTRLLDVTFNPLVALYFACQPTHKEPEVDGRVFVFVSPRCEFWSDLSIQAQSKVALLDYGKKKQFWKDILSGASLDSYREYFTETELNPINFLAPAWAKTKKLAPRIERQSGAFVIAPEIRDDCSLDYWCCKSYRIPENSKNLILEELDGLNINRASLFDGLDNVGIHVKTMYE